MKGIRSFMGWSHIPDIDSTANTSEDNPFAGPKAPVPGKVSVQMPTEDWLCRKLAKLNLTLVEGYPSHGSEAGGLAKDVFLRPAKSQSKWYGLFSDHKVDPSAVSSWSTDIAIAGLPDTLVCHLLHQLHAEFLRKTCADGKNHPEKQLLYATRRLASIDACLEYNKICRTS